MMYDDLVGNEFKLYVKYHFQLSDFLNLLFNPDVNRFPRQLLIHIPR